MTQTCLWIKKRKRKSKAVEKLQFLRTRSVHTTKHLKCRWFSRKSRLLYKSSAGWLTKQAGKFQATASTNQSVAPPPAGSVKERWLRIWLAGVSLLAAEEGAAAAGRVQTFAGSTALSTPLPDRNGNTNIRDIFKKQIKDECVCKWLLIKALLPRWGGGSAGGDLLLNATLFM